MFEDVENRGVMGKIKRGAVRVASTIGVIVGGELGVKPVQPQNIANPPKITTEILEDPPKNTSSGGPLKNMGSK